MVQRLISRVLRTAPSTGTRGEHHDHLRFTVMQRDVSDPGIFGEDAEAQGRPIPPGTGVHVGHLELHVRETGHRCAVRLVDWRHLSDTSQGDRPDRVGPWQTPRMDDRYWFANSSSDEGSRLRLLEAIADPRSVRLLTDLQIEEGWQCAELGAGAGSMVHWLADRVGSRGSVTAVDRDVTLLGHLDARPNVTLVEASIEDLDLPRGSLDLIHTRNVLMHIDGADAIVADLVEGLRPGGALLVEEADYFPLAGVTSPALLEVMSALVAKWTWARTLPTTISRLPVRDVAVTVDTSMLQGGSTEAIFWMHTLRSVEHRLTDPGVAGANGRPPVSRAAFDETLVLLADETFWTPLAAVVCVSCRRR
jgi:trans-aconitate methyltransferase